ncbi:MAG TPA: copper homeostasis membrane protein CopD [Stellaceae bacterium]|nr:copper homeostasis membrane protein CopD [Stellaceae bacterium]
MSEAFAAIRFVHFAAAMAAFGIGAFRLYAFAGAAAGEDPPARDALDRALARMMTAAAIAALVSALAIVPCVAAEMTGSNAAAASPATLGEVMLDTDFGHIWCWHSGFAALLAAIVVLPRRPWQPHAATAAALSVLASLGLTGHAAMDMGGGEAHAVNQMVHLTAAGLWLGGLLPLGLLLHRATRPDGAAYAPLARIALPHFSQMGYVAVALVALTGTVNSVMLAGSFEALAATAYGRLLTVKIALFAAMVALALGNRFRLMPRLARAGPADAPLGALYRSVLAEQALGAAILAVVAVLGTWPPANMAM